MFSDFMVYTNKTGLNRVADSIDINAPNTTIFSNNKIIKLSQFNIINTGYVVGNLAGITEEDIILTTLQHDTSAGLSLGLGLSLSHKALLVYAFEVFSVDSVNTTLVEEFCTTLVAQPSEIEQLLNAKADFSKLSKIIVVSSPSDLASKELINKLNSLQKNITVTFGTNETCGVLSVSTKPGTENVGKALPHTRVSVVDSNLNVCSVGTEGSLVVKGFNVAKIFESGDSRIPFVKNDELFTGIKSKMESNGNIILLE